MGARLFPRRGAPAAIAAKARRPVTSARKVRAYLAAQSSALLADWVGTSASANGVTDKEARRLRQRARELRENSWIAARYEALARENILGPEGVTLAAYVPRPRGKNDEASRAVETAWYEWANAVTADGRGLLQVLCTLVNSWKIEGEALLRLRLTGGQLRVEALDADLLDQGHSQPLQNGVRIEQGVEMDEAGQVLAYHIWDGAEDSYGRRARERVPASQILYTGHRTRPQQVRGITPLAPVMILINHLERLEEAVVILNRVTASKMYTMEAEEWATPLKDDDDELIEPTAAEEIAPGTSWVTPYGWRTKMLDPGQPTAQHDALIKQGLHEVAGGLNVSYMSLSGDLSSASYSSGRIGLFSEREGWTMDQQQLIADILRPLFAAWLRIEVLSRRLVLPENVTLAQVVARSEWYGRKWPMLEPLKDAEAIEKLVALRMTSRTRELNKLGLDFKKIIDELAEEEAYAASQQVPLAALVSAATPSTEAAPGDPARGLRAVS
jgi:lambda family phage portal protein